MESRDVLEIMIQGKEIILEKDVSDCDMYGRKLRYVFLEDVFINLEMVKRGFANIYTYSPDIKYAEDILAAERYVRENNLGLWELSEFNDIYIEVFYDVPGNDNENKNGECVVLENTGDNTLNTLNWTIKDSGTNIYVFGPQKFYPGLKIILFSGKGADGEDVLYWNSRRPVWNNDFDTLYLRDSEELLMGIYNY
jgi:micrococcal nuclease